MSRHNARVLAMQMVFQTTVGQNPLEIVKQSWAEQELAEEDKNFAWQLYEGVLAEQKTLNQILQKHSKAWDLERLGNVERSIMQVALYEMLKLPEIPAKVSINEAIEIAKIYCEDGASAFINGILDSAMNQEAEIKD